MASTYAGTGRGTTARHFDTRPPRANRLDVMPIRHSTLDTRRSTFTIRHIRTRVGVECRVSNHSMDRDRPQLTGSRQKRKNPLPIPHVDPPAELESDLLEVRDFSHAELLVQSDAGVIRQRDTADRCVDAAGFQD